MPKIWMTLLCCGLVLALTNTSRAVAGEQEELLRKIEGLEQQLKELKEQQKTRGEKESHCLQAVGREKFCACIAEKLPPEVGFAEYVHTAITAKSELGYEGMSPEQKRRVDATLAVRDACVEKKKGGFW
jgi:hypothetical protein